MKETEVPEGTIEYTETGDGPPVVLLHGLLMDYTVWDRCLPLLPEGFRYIRPVLPLGATPRFPAPTCCPCWTSRRPWPVTWGSSSGS